MQENEDCKYKTNFNGTMGITRMVFFNALKQSKMEDQGSRPILIVEENFDSIVKSQSAM